VLAEQEGERASQPFMRGRSADGRLVAIPNPFNAGTPHAYDPPAPGNQPHPVQAAVTPGWNLQ
jgi:hypothetical protein